MGESDENKGRVFQTDPQGRTRVGDEDLEQSDAISGPMQDMTFSTHILSLNAMALMHLGEVDGVPESERDLDAAEHVIDTLKMLQDKTAGNLNPDEDRLVATLLYDLKVKFVKAKP